MCVLWRRTLGSRRWLSRDVGAEPEEVVRAHPRRERAVGEVNASAMIDLVREGGTRIHGGPPHPQTEDTCEGALGVKFHAVGTAEGHAMQLLKTTFIAALEEGEDVFGEVSRSR